jgi:hypothetical protein
MGGSGDSPDPVGDTPTGVEGSPARLSARGRFAPSRQVAKYQGIGSPAAAVNFVSRMWKE